MSTEGKPEDRQVPGVVRRTGSRLPAGRRLSSPSGVCRELSVSVRRLIRTARQRYLVGTAPARPGEELTRRANPDPAVQLAAARPARHRSLVRHPSQTAQTALTAFAVLAVTAVLLPGTAAAVYDPPTAAQLAALRHCESTDNYQIATGNGFFGAYQFDAGTWRSLGYPGLPNQAAPATQDQAMIRLHQARGWQPWPGCTKKLGLVAVPAGRASTPTVQRPVTPPVTAPVRTASSVPPAAPVAPVPPAAVRTPSLPKAAPAAPVAPAAPQTEPVTREQIAAQVQTVLDDWAARRKTEPDPAAAGRP